MPPRKRRTFPIDDAGTLVCDVDRLIGTRMLLQANSGGGKSFALRRILEQTHAFVQQIVIDPEGEFSSLRAKYDYVYAAPSGGDAVANPRSAALLAVRLLELGVSAIVDIFELHPHERVLFVKLFLEALVNAPKKLWHPVIVVVDEAHVFAPKQDKAESLRAVIGLTSLGRKRAFSALLATQRIEKLHNDAVADLNNKLIGRSTLDTDMARAAAYLGFNKKRAHELRVLKPGHFFALGPAFSQDGVTQVHVGGVRTPHPTAGKRFTYSPPPPTKAIRALLPQLADLPAEAEQKARTVEGLRAEITELKREAAQRTKTLPVPAAGSRKEDLATIRALRKGLEVAMKVIVQISGDDLFKGKLSREEIEKVMYAASQEIATKVEKTLGSRSQQIERLRTTAQATAAALRKLLDENVEVDVVVQRGEPFVAKAKANVPAERSRSSRPPGESGGLGVGERAVLTAIAQHGDTGVDREQLSVLTGYKRSTRDAYVSRLNTAGMIAVGATITATADGLAALGDDFEPLPQGEALREYWLNKLPDGERALLALVIETYPDPAARDLLGEETGYKRSTRDAYLSRLTTRKLIVAQRGGSVRASDTLFAESA